MKLGYSPNCAINIHFGCSSIFFDHLVAPLHGFQAKNMAELKTYNGYPLWLYLPNVPAAAVFTILFALGTIAIAWQMFRTKAWYCSVFVIGGVCTYLLYNHF